MNKLLKDLCLLNGISGREHAVRNYIISQIKDYAEYETDALGNLIVYKKGKNKASKTVMVDAHMDEVGFMISGVTGEGFLKFEKAGGIDNRVFVGRSVIVGDNNIHGVFGIKPIHLIDKEDETTIPKSDDLYIDIGAENREDALKYVSIGDYAVFDSEYIEFGNGFVKSKALDDRAGCAILIDIIRSEIEYDCVFTFTVQEEVGTRGAACAAFNVNPDYAVVVETTTAADISGVKGDKRVCVCGDGPAVSFMDNGTIYNKDLFDKVLNLGKENNIRCQIKTRVAGGNNARAIHTAKGGILTQVISVPCRYLHSPSCVCKLSDIADTEELVKTVINNLAYD